MAMEEQAPAANPVAEAASQVMSGMTALAEMLSQEDAPPGGAEALAEVMAHFDEVMSQISSGEGSAPKQQASGVSQVSPQQGRPVGPAGV
jgi:hypothetical protein